MAAGKGGAGPQDLSNSSIFGAGAELSAPLIAAITIAVQRKASSIEDLFHLSKVLCASGDAMSAPLVRELEGVALGQLDCLDPIGRARFIELLLDCAAYQESIGAFKAAVSNIEAALDSASLIGNLALKRRGHNALCAIMTRFCNYEKACYHAEQALSLARSLNSEYFVFLSLANSVAILNSMGLLAQARDLALANILQPNTGKEFATLHLANASSGLKISHELGDMRAATIFYKVATDQYALLGSDIRAITNVYFQSARCTHLVQIGKPEEALGYVNDAIEAFRETSNIRIDALLYGAQATIHLAIGSAEDIRQSVEKLERLLELTDALPNHQEDILRILVKLHLEPRARLMSSGRIMALKYLRKLRNLNVNTKHRRFFAKRSSELTSLTTSNNLLDTPSYHVPLWISATIRNRAPEGVLQSVPDDRLPLISTKMAALAVGKRELRFRTSDYNFAENWAVAAELASGQDGRHCFKVGKLASLIAAELGLTADECVAIDLVSRLHEIGSIATVFSPPHVGQLRARGKFSPFCEHTRIGARLLLTSGDKLLRKAAAVARSHHEWWNGCGYPEGLSGSNIPLDGRICFLADTFINLVCPSNGERALSITRSISQIRSMAGMQIDPGLLAPFLSVVEQKFRGSDNLDCNFDEILSARANNGLRRELLSSLALA